MWLFTVHGFFSVVCGVTTENGKKYIDFDTLMVRARVKQHLINLKKRFIELAQYEIKENVATDYAFRIIVPKEVWETIAFNLAHEIDWTNFKDECHEREVSLPLGKPYVNALMAVWNIMFRIQPPRSVSGSDLFSSEQK